MDASGAPHPTDQILRAHVMGKLGDSSAESVRKHLESCAACRRRVTELASAASPGRPRDAQASSDAHPPILPATSGLSVLDAGAGSPQPPPASSLPPGLADHPDYEVICELGQGGMGTVYLARNRLMGRLEVLKVVSDHLLKRRGVLERFLAEIRNAARLHHPNVVTAYSAKRLGESLILAMEYVEGLDLSRMVKAKGPLPVANACNYVHQAALGLQHAHEHGMVHRDIKPSNLMLCRQDNRAVIKVLDFGLAKVGRESPVDGGLTHEGQMLGSPDYMAPEQISDARQADIRADVYSLGCTLYYLLSGGPPFDGTSLFDILQAHHSRHAPALNQVRADVPVELGALVGKMMAKDPERRFQQPKDVAQALAPFFKSTARGPARTTDAAPRAAVPPPLATGAPPAPARPAQAARPGSPAGIPSELLALQHDAEDLVPALAPQPSRLDHRGRWPMIAAAAVLGILVLAVIIYHLSSRKSASRPNEVHDDREVDVAKGRPRIDHALVVPQKTSAMIAKPGARYGLRFDPDRKSFVKISKLKYDGSHPITLEAYVRPLVPPDRARQSFGAILWNTGASGTGVFMGMDGYADAFAHSAGLWHGIKSGGSLIGRRTHLASVLGDRHLSFFVNGRRAGSLDLPGSYEGSALPFLVGAFAIADGSPTHVFNGIIEQVRISGSARYRDDFEPAEWLATDASTLLHYQPDQDTDDLAIDSSGNGNQGLILGAELVLLVDAPLKDRSPVADGKIGADEYGPPLAVDYADDRNPGRLLNYNTDGRKWSETVPPEDLSFALYAAHSKRSLFLAFRITDDFIDDGPEADDRVFFNDSVEIFIDGDRMPNDVDSSKGPSRGACREGFQVVSDVRGRKLTSSSEFANRDWEVATSRLADGYVIEFEIPLRLIDTADGAPFIPATTGSFLWFNAAVTDNDSPVHAQEDYGPLWLTGPAGIGGQSPWALGEKGWRVGLSLSGPRAAELAASSDGGPPRKRLTFNYEGEPVSSLALTRDGRTLVAGQGDSVRSWDLVTGRERFRVKTGRTISRVGVSSDGRTVVSSEYRDWNPTTRTAFAIVAARDGATGAARHEMKACPQGLHGAAVSPDGKLLVSTCWSELEIRAWDPEKGQPIEPFRGHTLVPMRTVFRPDGEVLASTGFDATVRLWDVVTRQTLKVLQGHQKEANALAFSADGKRLASGSYDGTARVWDAVTGEPIAVLEHDRPVLCLAFSPDGRTLATGSAHFADIEYKYAPALIRLWDLAERRPRTTFPEQPLQVYDMLFTPDGKTLITGDREGAIILWDVSGTLGRASR